MSKKVYKSKKEIHYLRIGKALIKIEFKNGTYETDINLFQKSIENSEVFREGIIELINND